MNASASCCAYSTPPYSRNHQSIPHSSSVFDFRNDPLQRRRYPLPAKPSRHHPSKCKTSWRRALPLMMTMASSSSIPRDPPATLLRRILQSPGVHQGPACFDALSAKLVQNAGFQFCFTSGFSISAARLGLPDVGYISYGEMLEQGQQITQAVSIPVIGDGDNGYGNAMNVKRTVKGFIRAGFAGVILEDQVFPKACGHTRGRRVVPREEAVLRIRAAIDAREESGSDIVIVARTDSRQAVSLGEALWRAQAFADAGADALFIDALASREEMVSFCEVSPSVPKMANMLEGGGKTPLLNPAELEAVGYKLVAYPLSLIGVSIRAMQDALSSIRDGHIPASRCMPTFDEMKEILGFSAYYEEERRYAQSTSLPSLEEGANPEVRSHSESCNTAGDLSKRSSDSLTQSGAQDDKNDQGSQGPPLEVVTPVIYTESSRDDSTSGFSMIWSRKLRIIVTGKDGFEKLDVRIPAGFLDGFKNVIPALGGLNIKGLLDDVTEGVGRRVLLDFNDSAGDRVQIILE